MAVARGGMMTPGEASGDRFKKSQEQQQYQWDYGLRNAELTRLAEADAAEARARKEEERQKWAGIMSGGGKLVGAVGGGLLGAALAPVTGGASLALPVMMGAGLGSGIGGAAGEMAGGSGSKGNVVDPGLISAYYQQQANQPAPVAPGQGDEQMDAWNTYTDAAKRRRELALERAAAGY